MVETMTNNMRLWDRVKKGTPDTCWQWVGEVRKPSGFGTYKKRLAHLLVWEASGRTIPSDKTLRHVCGNRTCVNPEHLAEAPAGRAVSPQQKRFWAFVDTSENVTGCWLWTGSAHTSGYGRIGRGGARAGMAYAHRVSWEMHNSRPVPSGHYVAHTCDVKLCVNPQHLFLSRGNDENMRDAANKDRIAHGERSGLHKFTDAQVEEARRLGARGETQLRISNRLGMSRPYVSELLHGKKRRRPITVPLLHPDAEMLQGAVDRLD